VTWTVVVTAYVTPADASLNTTATAVATATAASTAANTTFPAACTFNSSLPIENVGMWFLTQLETVRQYKSSWSKNKYTTKKQYGKFEKNYPRKGLRGNSSNFHIQVSMSGLYITTIDLPILLQANMWTDPGNI
jgi:hypothetical protein